jgi:thioredoxin-related protein
MKISLLTLTLSALLTVQLLAAAPQPETRLPQTLSAAAKEKKLAFILLGRRECSICQATRQLIRDGKIAVTSADYVMGDLNVDDPKTYEEFARRYHGEKFGEVLPFVVVTDSQGKLLASHGGYADAVNWNRLLARAKAKATGKGGSKFWGWFSKPVAQS